MHRRRGLQGLATSLEGLLRAFHRAPLGFEARSQVHRSGWYNIDELLLPLIPLSSTRCKNCVFTPVPSCSSRCIFILNIRWRVAARTLGTRVYDTPAVSTSKEWQDMHTWQFELCQTVWPSTPHWACDACDLASSRSSNTTCFKVKVLLL